MKDPLIKLCGYVLHRAAARALADLNRRLAPLGLRHAGVAMLMLVEARPGITQSQAGRMLDIQRANMVPFVARLERLGVIRRRQVDGRSQASVGVTLVELASIMRRLGAWQAMNFDGGGSTSMVIDGKLMNVVSDSTGERAVGNALMVVRKPSRARAP